MKLLLILPALLLVSCATFRGEGDSRLAPLKGVVGQRNVAGIELPLLPGKLGVGVGAWVFRPVTEAAIIEEEFEILTDARK